MLQINCADALIRHSYWDNFVGEYKILTVNWIIKKGNTVTEDTPVRFSYYRASKVSEGPIKYQDVTITVCSDPQNVGAPTYDDSGEFLQQTRASVTERK